MNRPQKIILPGGGGFLGRTLAKFYAKEGFDVVVLSRNPLTLPHARAVYWDGASLGEWSTELEGSTAVVNLAGRSVDCRYTEKNRRAIMDSRILSTRVLGQAIRNCTVPPQVWLNSGTATIYKHTYGEAHDETGEIGATPEAKDAFSIEVAQAWEKEFAAAICPNTRKVILRTAMVFGDEAGGVYHILRRLVRFGLGGRMGTGKQYMSWIHADDFCEAVDWISAGSDRNGIYNIAAPIPVSNAELMAELRKKLGVPIGLPSPRWMLEIGAWMIQTETELIIKSRRVVPGRLLKEGFQFRYRDIGAALARLVEQSPNY